MIYFQPGCADAKQVKVVNVGLYVTPEMLARKQVAAIIHGSPASQSGLVQVGDFLRTINGTRIDVLEDGIKADVAAQCPSKALHLARHHGSTSRAFSTGKVMFIVSDSP